MFLGHLFQHEAQEYQTIGHFQELGVMEIKLKLRVGALGDNIVQVPAELFQNVNHILQEWH